MSTCQKCGHKWNQRIYRGTLKKSYKCPKCQCEKWEIETTMSEELKPCPFCGSVVNPESFIETQGTKWGAIVCQECGAVGPDVRTSYKPFAEWGRDAAKEWNTRADSKPSYKYKDLQEAWLYGGGDLEDLNDMGDLGMRSWCVGFNAARELKE